MATDLSQLLAVSVRNVVPLLARRNLGYTYADRRCNWLVDGDARLLEAGLHRLYLAATELLEQGFLVVDATARGSHHRGCQLQLQLGGAGRLRTPDHVANTLRVLDLQSDAQTQAPVDLQAPRLLRAHGVCPATGATVDFASLAHAGFLFNVTCPLPDARRDPAHDTPPAAAAAPTRGLLPSVARSPARAWLVHADPVAGPSAARAAQAQGWTVALLPGTQAALRRLRQPHDDRLMPSLVVLFVSAALPVGDLQRLRAALPPGVRCACALMADAELLQHPAPDDVELCCQPVGGHDWQRWLHALSHLPAHATAHAADRAAEPAAVAAPWPPAPVGSSHRERVLVVDDDAVSAMVAGATIDRLGFQVDHVDDGIDAVAACQRWAPVVVLMDLDMPQLDGLQATRRIRASQRVGQLAPCRIVICSGTTRLDAVHAADEAGADAFLPKPLSRDSLQAQLRLVAMVRSGLLVAH